MRSRGKNNSVQLKVAFVAISIALLTNSILYAQQSEILVDLSLLDGIEITSKNVFSYNLQNLSGQNKRVRVSGDIIYRNNGYRLSYSYIYNLQPGANMIKQQDITGLNWIYSNPALGELFRDYGRLPQGVYRYCVNVQDYINGGVEYIPKNGEDACLYNEVNDVFLIELLTPENGAEIYEHNPFLGWVVNFPFQSELQYRLRLTEMKEGQNPENAIARNRIIYEDRSIMATSQVYPITAKPLEVWKPYVWTVDAYYKNILLGGAAPWKFTIIEDSSATPLPQSSSYIDLNLEEGVNKYYAVGEVKLKFTDNDFLRNKAHISFLINGKETTKTELWDLKSGVNFISYEVAKMGFKHKQSFQVQIKYDNSKHRKNTQTIQFIYVDPNRAK